MPFGQGWLRELCGFQGKINGIPRFPLSREFAVSVVWIGQEMFELASSVGARKQREHGQSSQLGYGLLLRPVWADHVGVFDSEFSG